MTNKDRVFEGASQWGPSSFRFDQRVADVFDDMVERSVPGYETMQLLLADIAVGLSSGHPIYDLGCSTGTTLQCIAKRSEGVKQVLVGFDQSDAMIGFCRKKLVGLSEQHSLTIEHRNILEDELFCCGPAGVVILCLTLQFVRPLQRQTLLEKIQRGMLPGGALLLVEKTICADEAMNQFFVDYYHRYKAEMGYSEIEIATKREALENVLIPFTRDENLQLLEQAGFVTVEPFFQWMNFAGFVAR